MALIKCRNCGHTISDKATLCPNCKKKIIMIDSETKLTNEKSNDSNSLKNNTSCKVSFIFGLMSIFFNFILILPIAAIIFGLVGINTFNYKTNNNKWMGIWGASLGILYLIVSISTYIL